MPSQRLREGCHRSFAWSLPGPGSGHAAVTADARDRTGTETRCGPHGRGRRAAVLGVLAPRADRLGPGGPVHVAQQINGRERTTLDRGAPPHPPHVAVLTTFHADGTAIFSPEMTAGLIRSYVDRRAAPREAAAQPRTADLSDRERQALALLGSGGSNAELATRLHVSEATVTTDVSRLLSELAPGRPHPGGGPRPRGGLLEGHA